MPQFQLDQNGDLYYERIPGSDGRPCLVFLHEGLGCVRMWKDFPERLCRATGCPGLVYDRLGYGKSSPLLERRTIHYMHDYGLRELPAVIDRLIPRQPFVLVGHSDGGSISLIFGAQRPSGLKGIISEAAHVFVDAETLAGIAETETAWNAGQMTGLARYHESKTETIFKAWSQTWLSAWFRSWNIEYALPSIAVPVLVIQGLEDKYGTGAQADAIVAKCGGRARSEMIPACGHTPHLEAQKIVVDLMTDFVSRLG